MKIKITKGGIFGKDGELEIGSVVEVTKPPAAWAGRYEEMDSGSDDKELVTNETTDDRKKLEAEATELKVKFTASTKDADLAASIATAKAK